jgi:hypothetical protein
VPAHLEWRDQHGAVSVVRQQRRGQGRRPDDRRRDAAVLEEIQVLNEELRAAGAWIFGGALHEPDTATVVRISEGEVLTTGAPSRSRRNTWGGFYIIEADDLDAALAWASKTTAAVRKPIEVRPFRAAESWRRARRRRGPQPRRGRGRPDLPRRIRPIRSELERAVATSPPEGRGGAVR